MASDCKTVEAETPSDHEASPAPSTVACDQAAPPVQITGDQSGNADLVACLFYQSVLFSPDVKKEKKKKTLVHWSLSPTVNQHYLVVYI